MTANKTFYVEFSGAFMISAASKDDMADLAYDLIKFDDHCKVPCLEINYIGRCEELEED